MTNMQTRKPPLRPKPTGKFVMQPFQKADIGYMTNIEGGSCNWSEMGSFKTSTAEWLIQSKTAHIANPRVLVITTKTGKGPYLESLWEILPDWDIMAVGSKSAHLVMGSNVTPWKVELPDPLYPRPVITLAHYHCFTNRACVPAPKMQVIKQLDLMGNEVETKEHILLEDGTFDMHIPFCNQLLTKHWDMIIVDEAHRMKNPDSQWTRNIKKLRATYRHCMSGTGFVNNPAEIWSLLDFVYGHMGKHSPHARIIGGKTGHWDFRDYFCEIEVEAGFSKIVGIKPENERAFQQLVRDVGVRRTMLECFPDITEPIETIVPVDLSTKQNRMYNEIQEYLMTLDSQGVPLHSPTVLSALNRLRQICVATPKVTRDEFDFKLDRRIIEVELEEPSSKLDAAMEIIEGLSWDSERKDQVVVFSFFRQPLVLLRKRLEKAKIPCLHLVSEMNDKARYQMWHEDWPTKQHQVFLCTLGVGSESINLTSANRAIFLDRSWSPAQNKQAIGRIYRPGQTGATQLIYIQAEGTVDYRVLETTNTKTGWFHQIFGGGKPDAEDENDQNDTVMYDEDPNLVQ